MFDVLDAPGQFIRFAVFRDIIVSRNPSDLYITPSHWPVPVFHTAVDRAGVHHIEAHRTDSRLANGQYDDVYIGRLELQVIPTAA